MTAVWTKWDGTKIPVRDMSDDHLVNAMAMCIRNSWNQKLSEGKRQVASFWIDKFGAELRRRAHEEFPDDDWVVGGCDRYGSLQS